jgi:cytochrome c biogenesis protein CcmG/thiol:disulfide interchange protein DsbE
VTGRRAGLLLIALFGAALLWASVRYSRQVGEQTAAVAQDARGDSDTVTLQFFRKPVAAPTLSVRDLDGRDVALASFRGKVVLINFWATWCPPCRAEIPDLVALQEKYRDQLQIIGVSTDEAPVDVVKRFAEEHHMNYPIVMESPEIEKLFPGIGALPTTFVLDRESRIVQKHVGMLIARRTEQETRALAGLPVDASIEEVDQIQGLKLENGAQVRTIPGIDLAAVPASKRAELLEKLNAQSCTCGCDLTVARCRVDDPTCAVSLPLASQIVKQVTGRQR